MKIISQLILSLEKLEYLLTQVRALYQQSLCSWDKDKIDGLSLMDMESF